MDKPYYPLNPIGSLAALSVTLGVPEKLIIDICQDIDSHYSSFVITSKSGKLRDVHEPKYNLKRLQKRINSRILSKVNFPEYLQGGLRDEASPRDYVKNATIHAKAETLISLDITSFYDSITEAWVFKIFKHFFHFPDCVCEKLTKLTTKNGSVPQGACTSSYLANLIFYDKEYLIVSRLRQKKVAYSRLLDDVTISSEKKMDEVLIDKVITDVIGMFQSRGLSSNQNKKKVEHRNFRYNEYKVTGLWVGHSQPKLRKAERRYIRQLVFECEKAYIEDKTSETYHTLWNSTSGKVSKMTHLGHSQAVGYRERLALILPQLSEDEISKLVFNIKRFTHKVIKKKYKNSASITDRFNALMYKIGICYRTDKALASSLKEQLKQVKHLVQTKAELWG